jgi:hypothetical protein
VVDDKSETVEAAATPGWRSETIWKRTDQRRKPSGGGRFRNEVSKFSDRTETYFYRKQWKRQNYRGFKAFHFGLLLFNRRWTFDCKKGYLDSTISSHEWNIYRFSSSIDRPHHLKDFHEPLLTPEILKYDILIFFSEKKRAFLPFAVGLFHGVMAAGICDSQTKMQFL